VARLALELDDRTLALARDGEVLSAAPAVAFDGSGAEAVGANAWSGQRRTPAHVSSHHLAELASKTSYSERALAVTMAELAARLEPHRAHTGPFWVAAPAAFGAPGLSAVLVMLERQGFRVSGFVDAATALAAALTPARQALVLEVGLHHVAVTAIDTGAQARRRRAQVSTRAGLLELYEAWLDLVKAAMVKRTRFDPLHDAATEQRVFDGLPALAREAAASGSATATIDVGEDRFEAELSRDQFASAGATFYGEIVHLIRELRHAGAPVTIIAPSVIADLPGMHEALDAFRNSELIRVADGAAAAAATLIELPTANAEDTESVRLIRRLPAARADAVATLATSELLGRDAGEKRPPSHVLYDGTAFALEPGVLMVGRGAADATAIVLPDGLAGISRRHCAFVHEGEHVVLVDHSAFGTFVNGERVAGRVRILAGDRVRVGEPGVELSVIAVGT
jgi:hypothetical protein